MSLQIPTVAELNQSILARFEAAFGQTIPVRSNSFLNVLSKVLAGVLLILYKFGGYIFLQMFVAFASTETVTINGKQLIPLVEWGRLTGTGDPTAATRAEMTIDITVTNQTGTLVAHSQLLNVDNGVTYLTLADVALSSATVSATIRASSDQTGGGGKGDIGNLEVGDLVSFVNPLPNVASDATVTANTVTGVDAEAWETYRARVSDRFRSQPQGGAAVDYRDWGVGVAGIINVYPYTGDPGEVDVYSEAEATTSNPDGIPTSAQLLAVAAAIELDSGGLASNRPISSYVNSYAITRTQFDISVIQLDPLGADETELKTKIVATLEAHFLAKGPYVSGLTLGPRTDRITRQGVSGSVQDVCDSFGAIYSGIVYSLTAGGPSLDMYSLGEGEKAEAARVTFI